MKIFLKILLFLFALTLSVDTYLQVFKHTSLCTTHSCQVVGDYVRLGELFLIKAGAICCWVLWLLTFFACRYDKAWLWGLVTLILMGALAFDGGLLGFQFVGLQEHCLLCIGVGTALLILLAVFAWTRRSWLILLLGLAVWCGGFAANSILDLSKEKLPPLSETAFLTWPDAGKGPNRRTAPQYHLFFSLHCGHCSKVIAHLAVNTPNQALWTFHCLDTPDNDLMRLAHILAADMTAKNPFLSILRWESEEQVPEIPLPPTLRQEVDKARTYCTLSGLRGVPRLLVDERPGVRLTLSGESSIVNYLRSQGVIKRMVRFETRSQNNDPLPQEASEEQ